MAAGIELFRHGADARDFTHRLREDENVRDDLRLEYRDADPRRATWPAHSGDADRLQTEARWYFQGFGVFDSIGAGRYPHPASTAAAYRAALRDAIAVSFSWTFIELKSGKVRRPNNIVGELRENQPKSRSRESARQYSRGSAKRRWHVDSPWSVGY